MVVLEEEVEEEESELTSNWPAATLEAHAPHGGMAERG